MTPMVGRLPDPELVCRERGSPMAEMGINGRVVMGGSPSPSDPGDLRKRAIDSSPFRPLGDYLVEAGLLSPAQVHVALNDQCMTGLRFGEILVKRGWVKEQTVEYFMHKVVEPERAELLKSMTWQKSKPGLKSSHRKGLVPSAPGATRPTGHGVAPAASAAPMPGVAAAQNFRAASTEGRHQKKTFVKPPAPPPSVAPVAKHPAVDEEISALDVTTCNGVSATSDYTEVSENLVWIG
jgi:hypothetical protein